MVAQVKFLRVDRIGRIVVGLCHTMHLSGTDPRCQFVYGQLVGQPNSSAPCRGSDKGSQRWENAGYRLWCQSIRNRVADV